MVASMSRRSKRVAYRLQSCPVSVVVTSTLRSIQVFLVAIGRSTLLHLQQFSGKCSTTEQMQLPHTSDERFFFYTILRMYFTFAINSVLILHSGGTSR